MNRRDFFKLSTAAAMAGTTPGIFLPSAYADAVTNPAAPYAPTPDATQCDVLVYGSTPSGIAAAVWAVRQGGCKVILACPKNHPGGMLASGLCTLDSRRSDVHSSFVREFSAGVQKLTKAEPPGPGADKKHGGHEPRIAEQFFAELIEKEHVDYWKGHFLSSATVSNGRIMEVELEAPDGTKKHVRATTFIDGTYEGDLAAAAGVPCRVGRESSAEYNESFGGIRYVSFHDGSVVDTNDSGDASPYIQAYCARCVFTTDPAKLIPFTKPDTYEQHLPDLLPLIGDFSSGKIKNRTLGSPLANLKFELNGSIDQLTSLDCPGMNLYWPEASRAHRAELEKFHLDHAASYVWFLQNDPRIPDRVRQLWATAGLHQDEFTDNGHWPWQIYVRQGRRIEGRAKVTQWNFTVDPKINRTPLVEHPIAVGEFAFDIHACQDRRFLVQGLMEGVMWYPKKVPCPAEAGQIPYAALLPKNLDNLLVPVALSATHMGFSVVRMEPCWMATGQAAGIAAGEAKKSSLDVAHIDPTPIPGVAHTKVDPYATT
jgi:hypothetical protein